MGLNSAGLTALLDGGVNAALYVSIGDGETSADQVSNERVLITWGGAVGAELTAVGVPYDFTGTADGPATHMLFWSAASGGTFYGFEALAGDTVFNSAGEFQIASLSLAGSVPDVPTVPEAPYALGTEVGPPTGTSFETRSSLGSPTATGQTYLLIDRATGETALLEDVSVYEEIHFDTTVTPGNGAGTHIVFLNCHFDGPGNWNVEINTAGGSTDVMAPLVVFDHCSFDGGSDGTTDKNLLGGYCWVIDSDMRGAEDAWAGWFYCKGIGSNFVAHGATIDLHSDGVQCTDTGRGVFYESWISAGTGPGASQAFRVGTEFGAAQDVEVLYCAIDRGGYAMQFRGDSGAGDISNVRVEGCRWTRNHEFGPVDVEETTGGVWIDNAYFDGEVIPNPFP